MDEDNQIEFTLTHFEDARGLGHAGSWMAKSPAQRSPSLCVLKALPISLPTNLRLSSRQCTLGFGGDQRPGAEIEKSPRLPIRLLGISTGFGVRLGLSIEPPVVKQTARRRIAPLPGQGLTRYGDGSCNVFRLESDNTSPMDQALKTDFRARVLVVDDEHAIAETLAIILAKSGFEAAVAHDGREAVAKARSWRPDAIVSDVVMPLMDGIEAAIQILAFLPACKIVLLSGQAATSDLVRHAALKGHYFEVMAKPVHPTELLRELSGL